VSVYALRVPLAQLALAAVALAVPPAPAAFPAAGELVVPQVYVRRAPDRHAHVVRVLGQFRGDFRPRVVLALEERTARGGSRWYRLSLPGRPNGRRGWVPADAVRVRPVTRRIVVHRGAHRLEVRRLRDGRRLFGAPIAVGAADAPTPLGRNFYVQWRYSPTDPFYGPFALETSAYSRISDWPGGGVVGIHGTSLPELIGQAVSHGCIRMRNEDVVRLRRLAPVGTPIDVLP
jgi:lipoprotein-anchoring transpeptidase ErfK/SrfK